MKRDIYDRAFEFACSVVELHPLLIKRGGAARVIAGQLLRSGTSLGANLEEANGAHSRADFVSKCRIALKEARESHYWLRLLAATDRSIRQPLLTAVEESNELVAILTAIIKNTTTAHD